ncbi:unnamed protein product [Onchocerca flexuosa]|uniref:Uncharacterized protein n=1 Tax=Onchocerca flexuosa TaxID=387005 RepID=A0A183HEK0_9BILA|nr:unnamed protein product [Onchocerca flexuosa]
MNARMRPASTDPMQTLSTVSSSSSVTTSNNDIILRNDITGSKSSALTTQHSVVPHIKLPESNIDMSRQIPPLSDSGRSKHSSVDLPYRPRASVEPFQINQSKPFVDTRYESSSCPPLNKPFSVSTFGKDRANFTVLNRNSSPSPPKDPYPTAENTFDNKAAKLDERTFDTIDHLNKNISSSASEIVEKHQSQQPAKNTMMKSSSAAILGDEQLASNLIDKTKLTRADQISIRPDTLRAAKRRLENAFFERERERNLNLELFYYLPQYFF